MNEVQSDAVLDLVDQCRVVSQAFEQQEAHRRYGQKAFQGTRCQAVAKALQKRYDRALDALKVYYATAHAHGIECSVLDGICRRNLPHSCGVVLKL